MHVLELSTGSQNSLFLYLQLSTPISLFLKEEAWSSEIKRPSTGWSILSVAERWTVSPPVDCKRPSF